MELIPVHSVGTAPSNLTNPELLNHAEREFPNPSGTLKMLMLRFQIYVEEYEDPCDLPDYEVHPCPTCGSPIKVITDACQ